MINLQLRPGQMATALGALPVMTFVENEFQVIALYHQNELHKVLPGDEAEIALQTYPGKIIKASVDSIVWAQGQGQIAMSPTVPQTGPAPLPPGRFAVRLDIAERTGIYSLQPGAVGNDACYTSTATTSISCARSYAGWLADELARPEIPLNEGQSSEWPHFRNRTGVSDDAFLSPGISGWSCPPPSTEELREEKLVTHPPDEWAAEGAGAEGVQYDWLAAFSDAQLGTCRRGDSLQRRPPGGRSKGRTDHGLCSGRGWPFGLSHQVGAGRRRVSSHSSGLEDGWSLRPGKSISGTVRYSKRSEEELYASTVADFRFARQSLAALVAKSWFLATERACPTTHGSGRCRCQAAGSCGTAASGRYRQRTRRSVGASDPANLSR